MRELLAAGIYEAFWEKLARAPGAVLLLDYDGTLAPFRIERDEAVPYPGVREAIRAILAETDTRTAVVSGREAENLVPLLGIQPAPEIFGSHGWEHRLPDGRVEVFPKQPEAERALGQARSWIERENLENRSESKAASVTVHWRGLEKEKRDDIEKRARAAWEPLLAGAPMELHEFDGGLEIRVAGRNKGDAVKTILSGTDTGAAVAYLGDDLTDEDAFEALGERALKVLVRSEFRDTRADVWITPPQELLDFLDRWKAARRGQ